MIYLFTFAMNLTALAFLFGCFHLTYRSGSVWYSVVGAIFSFIVIHYVGGKEKEKEISK